ncbi:MAG: hypothetical protein LC102_03910 [Ignavibacteriales bacterium]|nr:MAG: hypothetical protein F9K26_02350 [Ignavibacteriaceae bacterium]MBW7872274.1 hypothetical protein [Ignavibacteria bacterium]MCZ2142556.1 hypothetical protein [Ignavibacteriales bacterium]OQY75243.1 MAG: hypothetical protein B6D45_05885 [Ignavibacteriales bacterium UTCHB3]MBV6445579.1 hypothetical protein [Ignavibacteriaceae bacterium]
MLKTKIITLLAAILLFAGCSDAPSSVGVDDLGSDLLKVKVLNSETDSLTQTSSTFRRISPLGAASFALFGNALGVRSDLLLQFIINFDEATQNALKKDSIMLISARIVLTRAYAIGDTLQSFPVSAVNGYRITSAWDPLKVKIDSLPNIDFSADIFSSKPNPDSLYYFGIKPEIALEWMKNSVDTVNFSNNGLMLRAGAPTPFLIGFQGWSADGSNAPRLELNFKFLSSNKDTTVSFRTLSDAHVIDGGKPALNPDEMMIQSGTAIESRLYFDLSKLPENVFINNAELIIVADTTKQMIGNKDLNGISVGIFDELTNDSTFVKTSLYSANLYYSNGKYSGNLTTLVRQLYTKKKNFGFLLTTSNPTEGLETIYLKNSNAGSAIRPRLIITYTKMD